jgi:ubiquinone/menaquinone biosynthesis C-methylase UbiE
VADVGAGIGFMLPYLSRAVSPGGTVYAEDIFADLLDSAKERVRKLKLENVQFVLGDVKDPHLPAGEIDLVLMLDAYHHFEYPKAMLENLRTALKPRGRIVIVDFYKRGGMQNHVRLDRDGVVKEVEGFGWKLDASPELLPNQYIVIFKAIEPLTH